MANSVETLLVLFGLLSVTGCLAGFLAGLLGIGGGVVIVPILVTILESMEFPSELSMHMAVASSLATIVVTGSKSLWVHNKCGAVDFNLLRDFAPGLVLGALVGSLSSSFLSSAALKVIFGVVVMTLAVNMLLGKALTLADQVPASRVFKSSLGLGIGGFSALMGIGGGALSVPILSAFSVPIHKSIGNSSGIGLVIAIPGILGFAISGMGVEGRPDFSLGFISLPAVVVIAISTFLMVPLGAKMAHNSPQERLKKIFSLFLVGTGLKMLWSI